MILLGIPTNYSHDSNDHAIKQAVHNLMYSTQTTIVIVVFQLAQPSPGKGLQPQHPIASVQLGTAANVPSCRNGSGRSQSFVVCLPVQYSCSTCMGTEDLNQNTQPKVELVGIICTVCYRIIRFHSRDQFSTSAHINTNQSCKSKLEFATVRNNDVKSSWKEATEG